MSALFSSGLLLVRRRVRRDLALVLCWVALLAFLVVLAAAAPRTLVSSVDQGARLFVADAGSRSDLIVRAPIGSSNPTGSAVSPTDILAFTSTLRSALPPGLAATFSTATLTVISPTATVTTVDGVKQPNNLDIQMTMLTPQQAATIDVVQGALPTSTENSTDTVDVVVSSTVAKAANLRVGSVLGLPQQQSRFGAPQGGGPSQLLVVGIVDQTDHSSTGQRVWEQLAQVWKPSVSFLPNGRTDTAVTVVASPDGVAKSSGSFSEPLIALVRVRLNPEAFSRSLIVQVSREVAGLEANSSSLSTKFGSALGSGGTLSDAVSSYPSVARAASAQMTLMIAGLLGVAGAVVLLLSRLMVLRRSTDLALERARGASIASIGFRALEASLVISVVGGAIGVGILSIFLPDALRYPVPLVLVLVVAVSAPPVQSVLVARSLVSGRRALANRSARAEIVGRSRVRRVVIEGALLALAGAALFSIRTRGLLETRTDGVDPLLVAAPLLVSAAVTILVLRIYPLIVRGVASLSRRARGALGVLAAMQAERSLAVLPVLALTLAVALVAGGGLLIATVHSGQIDASWQRVGADVRITTPDDLPVTATDVTTMAGKPGVTAAASERVSPFISIAGSSTSVALLAIDRHYADLVALLPIDAGGGAHSAATLRTLAASTSATDPIPVVVDKRFARAVTASDLTISWNNTSVPAHVVGTVDAGPNGYASGPFVFVDLDALSSRVGEQVQPNTLLITGEGASAAASTLAAPKGDILTRASWLDAQQNGPLTSGVVSVMIMSVLGIVILAMVALLATALSGTRTRERSLAMLRTLGMRSRMGWWLALTELAPIVIAAVIGGLIAGIGMVLVIAPAMGLELLTGGLRPPVPDISAGVILAITACAILLLVLATAVEVVAHRRDRLTDMLRTGDVR
ncbi:MAG: FtsX-like permease family protein [Pseudolysinimonas sp.]